MKNHPSDDSRRWYWGSQEFREKMLKLVKRNSSNRNYRTSVLGRQKDRSDAEIWFEETRKHFGLVEPSFTEAPRPMRLAVAWALHHRTNQPQNWIAERCCLHSAANVSQQIRRIDSSNPPSWSTSPAWNRWRRFVRNC